MTEKIKMTFLVFIELNFEKLNFYIHEHSG